MEGKTRVNAPDTLSREYNNRALVPEHPQFFARWGESSARARGTMICYLERRYGDMPGETLDLFPARKGDGTCMMFIHGGYWRSLDKRDFSFLAPAWVDAGVSLAVVNSDLCPPVMTCVGGDESSEFHRQNALLGERWRAAFAGDIAMPGTHHFSVVDGLANQSSALFQGACRLMKLDK